MGIPQALLAGLAACIFPGMTASAGEGSAINAFVVLESSSPAVSSSAGRHLKSHGGGIALAFPPHAFLGNVPSSCEAELASGYGAAVFRGPVDLEALQRFGEAAVMAGRHWNMRYTDFRPPAPKIAPSAAEAGPSWPGGRKTGAPSGSVELRWDEVPGVTHYRLQISSEIAFWRRDLDTVTSKARYAIPATALKKEGTYYWRVQGLCLSCEKTKESEWTKPVVFQASAGRRARKRAAPPPANLPAHQTFKGLQHIRWPATSGVTHYRIQLSTLPDFSVTLVDSFAEGTAYDLRDAALKTGAKYFWRVATVGQDSLGEWTSTAILDLEPPGPITDDVLIGRDSDPPRKYEPR